MKQGFTTHINHSQHLTSESTATSVFFFLICREEVTFALLQAEYQAGKQLVFFLCSFLVEPMPSCTQSRDSTN